MSGGGDPGGGGGGGGSSVGAAVAMVGHPDWYDRDCCILGEKLGLEGHRHIYLRVCVVGLGVIDVFV